MLWLWYKRNFKSFLLWQFCSEIIVHKCTYQKFLVLGAVVGSCQFILNAVSWLNNQAEWSGIRVRTYVNSLRSINLSLCKSRNTFHTQKREPVLSSRDLYTRIYMFSFKHTQPRNSKQLNNHFLVSALVFSPPGFGFWKCSRSRDWIHYTKPLQPMTTHHKYMKSQFDGAFSKMRTNILLVGFHFPQLILMITTS